MEFSPTDGYQDAIRKAEAQGIRVDPENAQWLEFWENYKKENQLPPLKSYTGLD